MKQFEQLIENKPDDAEAYLVYADALQSAGDPRGELIALHHRMLQRPTDKKLAQKATRFIEQHPELLGPIHEVSPKQLEIEWYLGFIRTAELSMPSFEELSQALEQLLDSPAARYLQRLQAISTGTATERKAGYDSLARLLIERRRPVTLCELRLGRTGDYALTPELRAVFDRLDADRDPVELWQEVQRSIDKQRRLKTKFTPDTLPELQRSDPSGDLALDTRRLLIGLKAEFDKSRPIGVASAMRRVLTAPSLDDFAVGLVKQFEQLGAKTPQVWVLEAAGALGGNKLAAYLGDRIWSHQRAVRAMELMGKIGTPLAIDEIYRSWFGTSHPRRLAARKILLRLAESRGVELQQLLDRIPTGALTDAERQRVGERVPFRLADLMHNGHRLSAADFETYLLNDPIRCRPAAQVLWGAFSPQEDDRPSLTFRVVDPQTLVDVDGGSVTLAPDIRVGVLHPIELEPVLLDRWQTAFDQAGVEQPFEQLARPVHRPLERELEEGHLMGFSSRRVDFDHFQGTLEGRRWYVAERVDAGIIESWGKYFERQDLEVRADHRNVSFGEVRLEEVRLEDVHPVILSEVLWDMEAATDRRQEQAEDDGPRVLPQRGKYPFTEPAKSSRSKCVVCGEKIMKGTTRVGIERTIETPQFTGPATAWLHFDCRATCPELQPIDNLDQVLRERS